MRVVVNGCFDCFHDGHKYLIDKAFNMATRRGTVYILINSDISVSELKGSPRPIDLFENRLEKIYNYWKKKTKNMFCAYGPKLETYMFNTEEELKEKIDELRPDIILKGNDRPDVREIVGSDKWPVCILPRLKDKNGDDISTTNNLKEIK